MAMSVPTQEIGTLDDRKRANPGGQVACVALHERDSLRACILRGRACVRRPALSLGCCDVIDRRARFELVCSGDELVAEVKSNNRLEVLREIKRGTADGAAHVKRCVFGELHFVHPPQAEVRRARVCEHVMKRVRSLMRESGSCCKRGIAYTHTHTHTHTLDEVVLSLCLSTKTAKGGHVPRCERECLPRAIVVRHKILIAAKVELEILGHCSIRLIHVALRRKSVWVSE